MTVYESQITYSVDHVTRYRPSEAGTAMRQSGPCSFIHLHISVFSEPICQICEKMYGSEDTYLYLPFLYVLYRSAHDAMVSPVSTGFNLTYTNICVYMLLAVRYDVRIRQRPFSVTLNNFV